MRLTCNCLLDESGDETPFIAKALGSIARAKGMTQLARDTGLGRESLYKTLSGEDNPSVSTILKVMSALGVKLARARKLKADFLFLCQFARQGQRGTQRIVNARLPAVAAGA